MKQFADMAGMILDGIFLFNDLGHNLGGPHAGVEPIGDRAAFDNVMECLALGVS